MINFEKTYFTTATVLGWYPLLIEDVYKNILIDSFEFCVSNKRAIIYSFVIMDDHFHIIWEIMDGFELKNVRQNLLKFTAQKFRSHLILNDELILENFRVDKGDRMYQIWKSRPLSIKLYDLNIFYQKMNYVHKNLANKDLDDNEYLYSTASLYNQGITNWSFVTKFE